MKHTKRTQIHDQIELEREKTLNESEWLLVCWDLVCCVRCTCTQCTHTQWESKKRTRNNIQCPRGLMPEHTLNTFRWCIALLQIAFTNSRYCLWSILIFYFHLFCPRCCLPMRPMSIAPRRAWHNEMLMHENAFEWDWMRQERAWVGERNAIYQWNWKNIIKRSSSRCNKN